MSDKEISFETATIRLFLGVHVENKLTRVDPSFAERTIKHGYLIDPSISPDTQLLDQIEAIVGISGEKANAAFHKCWATVQNTPTETLLVQQIVHYLTTYGFQRAGVYREETVYIPHERLEIPDFTTDIPLTYIQGMTAEEILAGVIKLGSGIALSPETLADLMVVIRDQGYGSDLVEQIANRELRSLLYDHFGIAPTDPLEFLRYLVVKLNGDSLLIKNDALIEKIKASDRTLLDKLLLNAPPDLGAIFYRFKPIFLAMKSASANKNFFNRLRKKAVELHKPVPEDFLNAVTAKLKHSRLDFQKLEKRLHTATMFRKIRLAYALKHRLNAGDSIVYRVRNGRGWATKFEWPVGLESETRWAYDLVIGHIVEELQGSIEGKTVYIPPEVHYTLPATEKMFAGNWPTGSYIIAPEHLIVGVHWENTARPIDLDLSVIDESGKFGWDADYRSKDNKVLFSGDVTDAPGPRGATELFYFKDAHESPKLMMLNYYNFMAGDDVDCRIIVAHQKLRRLKSNHVVDPNKIIASTQIKVTRKQSVLGLIAKVEGKNRIYFANIGLGNSITSRENTHAAHARSYLFHSMVDSIDLAEILTKSGATVVSQVPEGDDWLDLSPQALSKTTFLDLLMAA